MIVANTNDDPPDASPHVEEIETEVDFPPGLARPALRALHAAGYTRLDQLAAVTASDLGRLHGMGPKAIGLLRDALRERGKSFATTKSS